MAARLKFHQLQGTSGWAWEVFVFLHASVSPPAKWGSGSSPWPLKILEVKAWKYQIRPWQLYWLLTQQRELDLAKTTFGFKSFPQLCRKWSMHKHKREKKQKKKNFFFLFFYLHLLSKFHIFLLEGQKKNQTILLLLEEHGSIWVHGRLWLLHCSIFITKGNEIVKC